MATSKTLTPTNVTIQIPEFTDQPDQRVNSNCLDKEADAINALNTQITNAVKVGTFTFTPNGSVIGSSGTICKKFGKLCIFNINGIYSGSAQTGWKSIGTVNVTADNTYYSTFSTGTGNREVRITNSSIDVYNPPGGGNDILGQLVFIST